jgi:carnitine O-acetyltransferase
MDYSPNNTAAVQALESAILLVSLDDYTPTTEDQRAWSYWSGGLDRSAQSGHGKNRWFDKHEIIVDESGESGFNGERKSLSSSFPFFLSKSDANDRLHVGWNPHAQDERIHVGRY